MKHRFEVLDIFRGVFASMVVFFHMCGFSNTPVLNNNFILNSDLFVDFFFVLSGFVITYTHQSLAHATDMQLFLKKRIFRLYPLHFVMLLVFVGMEVGKHYMAGHIQVNQLNNVNNTIFTFFTNLFLVHSIKMPGVTDVSWNIPSWSISAEMTCYLLFGGIIWLIHKAHIYKLRNLVYCIVAIGALAILFNARPGVPFEFTRSFDFGFLRAWIGFFTGAICFNLFSSTRQKVITAPGELFSLLEVICVVTMILMVYNGTYLKPFGYIYEVLFFISIYVFSFEKGFISTLLKKSNFLKNVGTYSYSIYMTHAFFLSIFNIVFMRLLKLPATHYAYLFILNYALIYFASKWTYKNIELKFQWKKSQKASKSISH